MIRASETARRLWKRFQSPIVLTLLGIALSAWLLPAIARQWQDRQKAQELKAALVTDMASSTARILASSEAHRAGRSPTRSGDWLRRSLEIEARLRAYFPKSILHTWQLYSFFVGYIDPGARSDARTLEYNEAALERSFETEAQRLLTYLAALAPALNTRTSSGQRYVTSIIVEYPSLSPGFRRELQRESGLEAYREFQAVFLDLESEIADEVLAAGPKGYSTTRGDLLRDLIP
jgi:hypothetical protein